MCEQVDKAVLSKRTPTDPTDIHLHIRTAPFQRIPRDTHTTLSRQAGVLDERYEGREVGRSSSSSSNSI